MIPHIRQMAFLWMTACIRGQKYRPEHLSHNTQILHIHDNNCRRHRKCIPLSISYRKRQRCSVVLMDQWCKYLRAWDHSCEIHSCTFRSKIKPIPAHCRCATPPEWVYKSVVKKNLLFHLCGWCGLCDDLAYKLYKTSKTIPMHGGFNLRKLLTNSSMLHKVIDDAERVHNLQSEHNSDNGTCHYSSQDIKVLGLKTQCVTCLWWSLVT